MQRWTWTSKGLGLVEKRVQRKLTKVRSRRASCQQDPLPILLQWGCNKDLSQTEFSWGSTGKRITSNLPQISGRIYFWVAVQVMVASFFEARRRVSDFREGISLYYQVFNIIKPDLTRIIYLSFERQNQVIWDLNYICSFSSPLPSSAG